MSDDDDRRTAVRVASSMRPTTADDEVWELEGTAEEMAALARFLQRKAPNDPQAREIQRKIAATLVRHAASPTEVS